MNDAVDGHQVQIHEFQCQATIKGKIMPLTAMQAFTAADSSGPTHLKISATENSPGSRVGVMKHTSQEHILDLMNHANDIFISLQREGADQSVVLAKLAELHWILVHAMPDKRGSAAKSEMAVRAAAYSIGTELPPFRSGIVADLEAFVTPLDEFKKNYAGLFEDLNPGSRDPLRQAVSAPL
jgi:hypothetical protein